MDLYVEDDVKAAATRCSDDLSCLSGNLGGLCRILACVEDETLFVHCEEDAVCSYRSAEDGRTLCTCPVRRRLHERYGV